MFVFPHHPVTVAAEPTSPTPAQAHQRISNAAPSPHVAVAETVAGLVNAPARRCLTSVPARPVLNVANHPAAAGVAVEAPAVLAAQSAAAKSSLVESIGSHVTSPTVRRPPIQTHRAHTTVPTARVSSLWLCMLLIQASPPSPWPQSRQKSRGTPSSPETSLALLAPTQLIRVVMSLCSSHGSTAPRRGITPSSAEARHTAASHTSVQLPGRTTAASPSLTSISMSNSYGMVFIRILSISFLRELGYCCNKI